MNDQNTNTQEPQGLDLESDAPLGQPACPLNPEDGECEACQ